MKFTLHVGDCIEVMRTLPSNSVDSVVTDPPYELGFMGKMWDSTGIAYSVEMWAEALRVLKPGGHLLAFSGSRTYHRMVCAIEDAGFEIRDQIMWVYGSGFPKSLDVSKAIDKAAGAEREVVGERQYAGGHVQRSVAPRFNGTDYNGGAEYVEPPQRMETAPATDAARQWQGWGTALKPAHEPIVVARKPLIGTVAANVLAHGTGAINVDGCRVGDEVRHAAFTSLAPCHGNALGAAGTAEARRGTQGEPKEYVGRWPANLIHDGSDEVIAAFPQAPGQMATASTSDTQRGGQNVYGAMVRGSNGSEPRVELDKSAARFFYCAKASKADRGEGNTHPTVKPTTLMQYLCRLVTPPGGVVLDPFMGSGSTGKAAALEGFDFIGVDLDPAHERLARARIEFAQRQGFQHDLLGDE